MDIFHHSFRYFSIIFLKMDGAQQVQRIRSIIEALSLEIATPDEAREILKLKGGANVGF